MSDVSVSNLAAVPETLLIPLAARIVAPQRYPAFGFADREAKRIADQIGFDPARFSGDVASMRGSVARALWFDRVVSAFLAANPEGLCVSIGSGLDDRPARIGLQTSGVDWVDVEFAEVARLRDALIAPRPNVRCVIVEDADPQSWLSSVPWTTGRPALVLAEGVLMYFSPEDGERLLRRLTAAVRERSASLDLAADFATPVMVRNSRHHKSLSATRARFVWGVGQPADLTTIAPGLAVVEVGDIPRQSGLKARTLSALYRAFTGRPIYFTAHCRVTSSA